MENDDIFNKMDKIGPLSQLSSLSILEDILNKRFFDSNHSKNLFAILFIGFENITQFEDTINFDNDDRLMIKIAHKLSSIIDSKDLLVKAGKGQYVIMQDLSGMQNPESLAKDIMHMMSEPCVIDKKIFYIHTSIGISLYPFDGDNTYQLVKIAEHTMKEMQKKGKNYIGIASYKTASATYKKTIQVQEDLPTAIENGDIYFAYQPQYSLEQKRFVGAEILARWKHPKYGEISPEFFIPLAEASGMIAPLTMRALVDASKVFSYLENHGINDFSLSVNISPLFLITSSFYESIEFLIEQYDLKGKKLNFEITEEILMKHTKNLRDTLERINALDISIELDDFGTGYMSLQHLASLPIDTLKIDKIFIDGIENNEKKQALFRAMVEMSHALNVNVIVEGVETEHENRFINTFRDIMIQGYYYSKPLSLNGLIEKLTYEKQRVT